jgi:hypothetical protein
MAAAARLTIRRARVCSSNAVWLRRSSASTIRSSVMSTTDPM